jgi:hypothetical protein
MQFFLKKVLPVFFLIYRLTNRQQMQWLGERWMMSRFLPSFGRTIISNPTAQWVIAFNENG